MEWDEYVVERIVAKWIVKVSCYYFSCQQNWHHLQKKVQYKVRWQSYGPNDDFWLDLKYLNCEDLVNDFENSKQ
jgi:hypothetical protein